MIFFCNLLKFEDMENVNLYEIRRKLKHGDLAIIANRCNCTVRAVSEVLNKGRDCNGRYEEIVGAALDLLKGEAEDKKNIVAKAKEVGMTTSNFNRSVYHPKQKSKSYQARRRGINPLFYVAGAIAVGALLFTQVGAKLFGKTQ